MTRFKCPKCGSEYFSRDVIRTDNQNGWVVRDTVRCNGESSAGPDRCDWRGAWPVKAERASDADETAH